MTGKGMSMDLSADEALKTLQPHLNAFCSWPKKAWETFQRNIAPQFSGFYSKRTRASIIHDLMINEAIRYSDKTPSFKNFNLNNLVGFVADEKIALRLKKLDRKKLPKNIPTDQVQSFRSQRSLPGISVIHHLEIGYCLDNLERGIDAIYLVYPRGLKNNFWSYQITESEAKPIIEDIFRNKSEEVAPATIRPKNTVLPFGKDEAGGDANDESKR